MTVQWRHIGAIVGLLLAAYVLLALWAGTPSFLATVTSDSMAPSLQRGDWVILQQQTDYPLHDVVVFDIGGSTYVHRIVAQVEQTPDVRGPVFRTQGDVNRQPDAWQLSREQIRGRVVLSIPALGGLSLWLAGK